MFKDSHVHSKMSHDGKSFFKEYTDVAAKKNVDEITFTEHYDVYDGINTNLKELNVEYYFNIFLHDALNNYTRVNFGLEIGLQPDIKEKVSKLVSDYPFDFIIGSSHITCKKDMAMDKSFFDGLTRKEAYLKYFNEVLENIKLYDKEFDVYGHLDYVVRYGGYDEKIIKYDEFQEVLDEILKLLIKNNKGIEVNTSGFRYNLGYAHPNIEILKRYKELGGKIITIGSDAHHYSDLASHFNEVYDLLEELGYVYYAIYHERDPKFIKIRKEY